MKQQASSEPSVAAAAPPIYLNTIKKSLRGLAAIREKEHAWVDLEKEPGEFSNAYKICDALQSFLLAFRLQPLNFAKLPLSAKVMEEDLSSIFASIEKEGFVPGAYVYYTGVQFTDFAADVINLILDLQEFSKSRRFPAELHAKSGEVLVRSVRFLMDAVEEDESGCRWAATPFVRIGKVSFAHVYYTATAASALARALRHHNLAADDRERIRRLIEGAGAWLRGRRQDNNYYSDEHFRTIESVSTLYCLSGILHTWEFQKDGVKEFAKEALRDFTRYLAQHRSQFEVDIFYQVVRSEKSKRPDFVDDRTTIANVLSTLCVARQVLDAPEIINNDFFRLLGSLANDIAEYQDESGLWDRDYPYIYSTVRAIEALLQFEAVGKVVSSQVNEMELRDAVRDALGSDQVLQAFMREIRRVLSRRVQVDQQED